MLRDKMDLPSEIKTDQVMTVQAAVKKSRHGKMGALPSLDSEDLRPFGIAYRGVAVVASCNLAVPNIPQSCGSLRSKMLPERSGVRFTFCRG
jgi:hypothetical protein